MGIYTICFAWEEGAVCKKICHKFYAISIVEKEKILQICMQEKVDGVTSIASDIAVPTVNYITYKMGLNGNSMRAGLSTTNKLIMRNILHDNGIPVPKYRKISSLLEAVDFEYPFMVKAVDRSGSRGIRLVNNNNDLQIAFKDSLYYSFTNYALIEEYFEGTQYSFEMFSQGGKHVFIAITEEFYTGPPFFVEEKHVIPGRIRDVDFEKALSIVRKSLSVLGIKEGASHSEIRINPNGEMCIIEVASRMGGDFRSTLIDLSSGLDFNKIVVKNALGIHIDIGKTKYKNAALIKWILNKNDYNTFKYLYEVGKICQYEILDEPCDSRIVDSSQRFGYFIIKDINNTNCLNLLEVPDEK